MTIWCVEFDLLIEFIILLSWLKKIMLKIGLNWTFDIYKTKSWIKMKRFNIYNSISNKHQIVFIIYFDKQWIVECHETNLILES